MASPARLGAEAPLVALLVTSWIHGNEGFEHCLLVSHALVYIDIMHMYMWHCVANESCKTASKRLQTAGYLTYTGRYDTPYLKCKLAELMNTNC